MSEGLERSFSVEDYDLAATLTSGQAFRWKHLGEDWSGVVSGRWVRLRRTATGIHACVAEPVQSWDWLRTYLQLDVALGDVLRSFPTDPVLSEAVQACHGLRLLKQDPWECLASFILSSTKQIVQIQQVISLLCREFGSPVPVPEGEPPAFAFPSASQAAEASEAALRACKMGFRAPYLLATAKLVASGAARLDEIERLPLCEARAALMDLPGVGRKIADCALLFGFGFPAAFPVDVWVLRALKDLYFPRRRIKAARLRHFADTHFGPCAGYAQQYLFHYMRTQPRTPRAISKS